MTGKGGISSIALSQLAHELHATELQIRRWCHECSIPIQEANELSVARVSVTALPALRAKKRGEPVCPTCKNLRRVVGKYGAGTCWDCTGPGLRGTCSECAASDVLLTKPGDVLKRAVCGECFHLLMLPYVKRGEVPA